MLPGCGMLWQTNGARARENSCHFGYGWGAAGADHNHYSQLVLVFLTCTVLSTTSTGTKYEGSKNMLRVRPDFGSFYCISLSFFIRKEGLIFKNFLRSISFSGEIFQ